jgi:hypothetical protein
MNGKITKNMKERFKFNKTKIRRGWKFRSERESVKLFCTPILKQWKSDEFEKLSCWSDKALPSSLCI